MSDSGDDRRRDTRNAPAARSEATHEPIPGPFVPGPVDAGGPYEWLTPQRAHPTPLVRDPAAERAAS